MVNNLKQAIADLITGRAPALTTIADLRAVEGFAGDVSHYVTSAQLGFDVLVVGDASPGALKALDKLLDEKVIEPIACSPIFYMRAITVIETKKPSTVGKTYKDGPKGELVKTAVADMWEGVAQTIAVPDTEAMGRLLQMVTSSTSLVLANGIYRGAGEDEVHIRTEPELERLIKADGADYAAVKKAGVVYTMTKGPMKGLKVSGRLQAFMEPAGWMLLDADEPEGFPDAWRPLPFQQRIALLEPYAPGISTAERVELRGSSARVVRKGGRPGEPSHGWIAVDNPADLSRAASAVRVHAVAGGTSFGCPRYSRTTGLQIGTDPRTSIDLMPWHKGRFNFDSQPVIKAKGYELADAGIRIVNRGGGAFDPTRVADVTTKTRREYKKKTGHSIHFSKRSGGGLTVVIYDQLTLDTPIEVRGDERTLRMWAEHMVENGLQKLRCEAPFRASSSEASFIAFDRDGNPFIYDSGMGANYSITPEKAEAEDFDAIYDFEPYGADDEPVDDGEDYEPFAEGEGDPDAEAEADDADFESLPPQAAGAQVALAFAEDTADLDAVDLGAAPGADHAAAGDGADEQPEGGGAQPGTDGNEEDDAAEVDLNAPVSVEDVKTADLTTPEGVALVDRYRDQQLAKLNSTIGYVVVEGKGAIVRVGQNGIGELGVQFISLDAERARLANKPIPYVSGTKDPVLKWTKIFPWWLEWSGRRTYDGIIFRPKREVKAVRRLPPYHRSGLAPLNLFTGTAWDAAPGECKPILEHIREVLCGNDKEGTTYVLNWFARMVQQPQLHAETVLVFRAGQGIGKGTVTNIFRRYFGVHGLEITNDRDLTGFNDHLATSIFISLNEAVWGGNKQSEGTFKSLITERELTVERKYLPKFKIRNHTHLVVSSNSDWAVPIGHDDRRFAALNPSDARAGDRDYFNRLHACIEGGGDRALIHYLLGRDISKFNPRNLPAVAGSVKFEQKLRSANSVARWLVSVLQDGGLVMSEEDGLSNVTNRVFVEIGFGIIVKAALHAEYVAATRGEHPESLELFSRKLHEILGPGVTSTRVQSGYQPAPRRLGGKWPCYKFHDLGQLRAACARYMGEAIKWEA
jgi:hypothetical protein